MANNRMWLLHKPSGKAVMLGKRYGSGWAVKDGVSLSDQLAELFALCEGDDWTLAMEDSREAPSAFADWSYTKKHGILKVLENGD